MRTIRLHCSAMFNLVFIAGASMAALPTDAYANPTCRIAAFKSSPYVPKPPGFNNQPAIPADTAPIADGELFKLRPSAPGWTNAWIDVWLHNRSRSAISYRRDIVVTVNQKQAHRSLTGDNPRLIRNLGANDSLKVRINQATIYKVVGGYSGLNKISIEVSVLTGRTTTCNLAFTLDRVPWALAVPGDDQT